MAKAVTKTQSLAWSSLTTMLTVEAPVIESIGDGIQVNVCVFVFFRQLSWYVEDPRD